MLGCHHLEVENSGTMDGIDALTMVLLFILSCFFFSAGHGWVQLPVTMQVT